MNYSTKKHVNTVIYHCCMVLLCFALLYPLLWLVISSFKEGKDIIATASSLIPQSVTIDNYVRALKGVGRNTFWDFTRNSLFMAITCSIGSMLANTLIAFGFARMRFPGRKILFAIMIATMALPGMVLQIPRYLLFSKLGWIGTFLPIIVPAFFGGAGNTFMLMMFMRNVPRELDEAARIDGCSIWGLYTKIMLPLVRPCVIMVGVLRFIDVWGDFYSALIYLNKPEMYPIGLALKMYNSELGVQYGPLLAMSVLSLIPIMIIFVFFQKSLIEGVATVGLKG